MTTLHTATAADEPAPPRYVRPEPLPEARASLRVPQPAPPPVQPAEWQGEPRRRTGGALLVSVIVVLLGATLVGVALATNGSGSPTSVSTSVATTSPATTSMAAGTTAVAGAATSGLTDVSDMATRVVDSVVKIEITATLRGRQTVVGSGSGVVVDADGTIVTNAHVVQAGTGVEVTLTNGDTYEAEVVSVSSTTDLALVRIDASDLAPIEFGSTPGLLVGDPLIAVGNPLGLEGGPSVSTGIVSALGRTLEDAGVTLTGIIQTDAAITEGSSGGALLDGSGRLVGITTAVGVSSVGVEGMGFAIPVEAVSALLAASAGV